MNLDSRYAVKKGMRFRAEEFGGVIYRRQDDRLHFLKSRLAIVLLSLAETGTVREIAACIAERSSNEQVAQENILKILCHLKEMEIVDELES